MNRRVAFAGPAISASFGMFTSHASAAAPGFTGTGGFIVSGGVGNIAAPASRSPVTAVSLPSTRVHCSPMAW